MKFLHLGDLHLGKFVNGFPMLGDQRVTLERVLADAVEREVDVLVLAGDLYDSGHPSAAAVRVLGDFLAAARDAGLEVVAIPGNHDAPDRVGYLSPVLARQGLHLAPPFDGGLSSVRLEDEYGPVTFWLMPYLRPVDVQRSQRFEEGEVGPTYTEALGAVIEAAGIDPSERNVLVAHQFVTAGGWDPEKAGSETIVGTLGNVDGAIFDDFDYVALGHLHRPQRMGRPEVRYAGSLLKYSRSEVGDRKSGVLVELGPKGEVDVELLPLRPPRDMRLLEGRLAELLADDYGGRGDTDDYIHVILNDELVPPDAMVRLRRVYPNVMSLEVRNASTEHVAELEAIPVVEEDFDPVELFATFYEEQNGTALTEGQRELVVGAMARATGAEPDEGMEPDWGAEPDEAAKPDGSEDR